MGRLRSDGFNQRPDHANQPALRLERLQLLSDSLGVRGILAKSENR